MSNTSSRIASFDSLRGLAACTVVLSHLFLVMKGQANATYDWLFQWIESAAVTPLHILWDGHGAVVLFFTLSGFVLYLLLAKAKLSLPAYAAKRVVRLYVPYFAAIVLGLIGAHAVHGDTLINFNDWIGKFWSWPISGSSILDHLFFLGQFNSDHYDFTIWTLVHEMRISLLFPIIFLMVRRLRWWLALLSFVFASGLMVLLCQPVVREHVDLIGFASNGGLTAYMYTIHYLLAFAIGAVLAHHRQAIFSGYARLPRFVRVAIGVSALALYLYGGRLLHIAGLVTMMPYDWPIMIAAALFLIVAAAEPRVRRALETPACEYLGRISYSLYLFHSLVLLTMLHLFAGRIPLGWLLVVTFGLCFVVSDLAWRMIERPAVEMSRAVASRVEQARERLVSRYPWATERE